MCDRCSKYNETLINVFYHCRNRKKIWNTFEPIIKKLDANSENKPIQNPTESLFTKKHKNKATSGKRHNKYKRIY